MPLAKWKTWTLGAVDFCETLYDAVRLYATAYQHPSGPSAKFAITEVKIDHENASANPNGVFTLSMQYNRLPTKEEAIE